jgi:periplasmic protein TonB
VARGLLRKGMEGTPAAASMGSMAAAVKPATAPVTRPVPTPRLEPPAPALKDSVTTEQVKAPMAPLPSMAASAKAEQTPAIPPAPLAQASLPVIEQQPAKPVPPIALTETDRRKEERVTPAIAAPISGTLPSSQGASAAPAPAREVVPEVKEVVKEAKREQEKPKLPSITPVAIEESSSVSSGISDGPTFAALGVEDTSAAGGSKKILIGVVALVVLVALAYFGWTQLGQSHSSAPQQAAPAATQPAPQDNTSPPVAPMSTPAPAPTTTVERASAATTEHAPKPSPQASKPSAGEPQQQITLNSEPETKKAVDAPLRVKPAAPSVKSQSQADEAAAPPPSALSMNSPDGASLGGLLTTNAAKPTLARVKLSQGVSQGLLIKRVPPKYPPSALQTHLEGSVQIEATIDKQGVVTNPKVVKGDRVLAAAALDAVRQWRYKPYYLDGEPVEVQTEITINFKGN